jgi:pimeloyl-ACP methyl ester carboxylesterase
MDERARWRTVRSVFEELLALPAAARAPRLAAAELDEASRSLVARMLAADAAEHAGGAGAPRRLGRYELGARIGAGGMGEVYVAYDAALDRRVALKLVSERLTRDKRWLERFQREARAASAVNHPGVLTIHEVGVADGVHFLATEYVEGETLRALFDSARPTPLRALELVEQIAEALEAAHAAGIVHRDVKPENVMVRRDGLVKVLDFGLAKASVDNGDGEPNPTRPGVVMGTLAYLSPEQARGAPVDARADVFSLGVLLYEALTGSVPFAAQTPLDALVALLQREPAALAAGLEAELPGLGAVLWRALEKDRARRYQSAREFAAALRELQRGAAPLDGTAHGPPVCYAQSGEVNIAYQVLGVGPPDLVFVMGWVSHLESFWTEASFARFLRRLASFSRVILFDKRGTGLSDRVAISDLPTLEQRMDDVRAVMDAVGSHAAVLCGVSEGGPMSCLFAATYPERTLGLVMIGSYARRLRDVDYPWGPTAEERERFLDEIRRTWGGPVGIDARAPSRARDTRFRDWWASYLRQGASPTAAVALTRMNADVDVRPVLPSVRVPTLVVHRKDDRCLVVEEGRYMAERIPGARFVELPGADHLPFVGDQDTILDVVAEFVGTLDVPGAGDRVLATVLVVEVVGAAIDEANDGGSASRIDEPTKALAVAQVERTLTTARGRVFVPGGRRTAATATNAPRHVRASFDGPVRAIRTGLALTRELRRTDLVVRVGVHTGECDVQREGLSGATVVLAEGLASRAPDGGVLVTGTVRDLAAGAGLEFEAAGELDGGALGTLRLHRAL